MNKTCYWCNIPLFRSVFKGYNICTRCSSLFTDIEEPCFEYKAEYAQGYISSLAANVLHYRRNTIPYFKYVKSFYNGVEEIYDLGGGIPIFNLVNMSWQDVNPLVHVVDLLTDEYKALVKENKPLLKKWMPNVNRIRYMKKDIFSQQFLSFLKKLKFNTIVSMVHFIEHLSPQRIDMLFKALYKTNARIVIYGPNIATARDSNWFHFRCTGENNEHITFLTKSFIANYFSSKQVLSADIGLDYLITLIPRNRSIKFK